MDPYRPIDDASTPEEVMHFVLTQPLEASDRVRDVLWDHRATILGEIEATQRLDVLKNRKSSDYLFGPYGVLGPYGVISLLLGLIVGYFTLQAWLVLLMFGLSFFFCTWGLIRTTPRWTIDRIETTCERPACGARFAAWVTTQNTTADLRRLIVAGVQDSTDYYGDLVSIVLTDEPKFAKELAAEILRYDPQNYPWLWRYAPSLELLERIVGCPLTYEVHDPHLRALYEMVGRDLVKPLLPETGVARDAFEPSDTQKERKNEPRQLTETEILRQHPDPALRPELEGADEDIPDFASLGFTDHPLTLHMLDLWRRTPDAGKVGLADHYLRLAISARTGVKVPRGESIEDMLDRLLFPLLESEHAATIRAEFLARRERDMIAQRREPLDHFSTHFCHDVHRHVLWGTYLGHQLRDVFRVDETYQLVNLDDEPLQWEPHVTVGVVHPLELTEKKRNAWQVVFADYGLRGFDQLSRQIYAAPPGSLFEVEHEVDLDQLGRSGWTYLPREGFDLDDENLLTREFEWNGAKEKAVIEISPDGASLAFWSFSGAMSVPLKRPLADVDPVVMSEALYALHQATAD